MNNSQKKKIIIDALKGAKQEKETNKRIRKVLSFLVKDKVTGYRKLEQVTQDVKEVLKEIRKEGVELKNPEELKKINKSLSTLSNLSKLDKLTDIEKSVKEIPKSQQKQTETIAEIMIAWLSGITQMFSGVIAKATFKVQPTQASFETPQLVVFYDPLTKKTIRPQDLIPEQKQNRNPLNVYVPINELQATINDSLDQYKIADVDDATSPKYYGFTNKDGYWYILKNTSDTTFRYVKGTTDYVTAWTDRAAQTYDYFHNVF